MSCRMSHSYEWCKGYDNIMSKRQFQPEEGRSKDYMAGQYAAINKLFGQTSLGLMNLDNHVEYMQSDGTVNLKGAHGNHNTISNLQGTANSVMNFGLVNLGGVVQAQTFPYPSPPGVLHPVPMELVNLDNHVEYLQAAGHVNFQGAAGNHNTVGNLQGVKGSVISFGI